MARTVYVTTELTGGGSALDGVNGNVLVAGDLAFHIQNNTTTVTGKAGNLFSLYMATTNNASESSPEIIEPDSNPGDWNWTRLMPLFSVFNTTGMASTMANYGVSIIRTTGATVHVLKRPKKGVYKKIIINTTSLVKIRLSTAVATYGVRIARQGKLSLASTACVIIAPTSKALLNGFRHPVSIELIGRSTDRWELMGINVPTTGLSAKKFPTFSTTT
jgi:hypothetical protein